ncbi:branched-chain amino acid transporter permease [Saccharothrix sp. ST-888]|uniref:branched-chain amino acid transporter permease n=1 Tax=Saccharothrix sp. ST-888 TaxID=1427391 RepID=UPI0005ED41F0|nr:AzlD domain-containing protein [Saccharothrix sp. ST-888]KJK55889.1 branched-chain amino acid ABC transporter [Saccharothrix sp. ST-888]
MPGNGYLLVGLAVILAVTFCLRAAPFAVLGRLRDSALVAFLATTMPTGVMVILVVYTLRDLDLTIRPYGLPAALGVAVTAALHLWRRSALLSIVAGTGVCMLAGHLL